MFEKLKNRDLKTIYLLLIIRFNRAIFNICKLFPLNPRLIVFESTTDYTDNAQAFYEEFISHNNFLKYKIVWLVDNPKNFKNTINTIFVSKKFLSQIF